MSLNPRITVAAVIEQQNRFLMVEEPIAEQLLLNQPAGHLEDGESLLDAVVREVREETAWEFEPLALVGFYRWRQTQSDKTFIRFCFTGKLHQHHAEQALDADIARTLWLNAQQVKEAGHRHRSPLVQQCIADYLNKQRYPLEILKDI